MEEHGRSSLYCEGDRFPLDSFYRGCSYVHTCCCSLSQSSCRTKHQMFRLHNLKSPRSSIRLAVLSINLSFSLVLTVTISTLYSTFILFMMLCLFTNKLLEGFCISFRAKGRLAFFSLLTVFICTALGRNVESRCGFPYWKRSLPRAVKLL